MTSRPALGTHGSGAPPRNQVRRPSKPVNALPPVDCIDPALEDPTTHNGAGDARPPPRGRPPLFYSTFASNGFELPLHPFPYQPTVNLPVPPRPGSVHSGDASQQQRIQPGGTGVKDAPKLTAPEVVPAPVQFPGGKAADLFPWTGNNPEDTLSETLVKGGISNKPQIMNETNTARPSLWSNLKNKSGITTLSTLFVAVLEKRQQNGRLQTPNTFKPPPRLTLRDSTRESWLHDLANPTVSLRRLSRTIPHGLTGKVLLDQCLNKNIPLPRALWLAKCVGINELRAHKRKGQAGTVTWGRGWTSSVEQFLDSVISTIGQGDWKPRITYALQLATHLYREHLLDDDHFLDWMLHGLDTCPNERLFIWLLVASIPQYWSDISSCRQRGKRLAESLLGHLSKLYQVEDTLISSTALQFLENTLLKLLATRPACLLLPASWRKHNTVLKTLASKREHPQIKQAVERLNSRNQRLLKSSRKTAVSSRSLAARVFQKLDSVDFATPVRMEDLSYECMEIISNAPRLISVLLQWASSCYREGSHRLYLAVRLLRKWSHIGADVYDGVISFFQSMSWTVTGDMYILLRIVAELVRSKHFSAGRYLQWLIATGSLGGESDLSSPSSWAVRLITAFPISGLSDQVRNLRYTLLRGTEHTAELEEQALNLAKRNISQAAPTLFGLSLTVSSQAGTVWESLSSTVRLELGIWLRQRVAQYAEVNEHVPTKDPSVEETAAVSLISTHDFHVVRSYLERSQDLAILADVVGIATSTLDPAVLSSVVDTLHYHVKVFRAIGAFDPLFGRVAMRYAALRTVRFPERELLLSLQSLARKVQPEGQLMQLLSYDVSRLDQKNSIAACSPASDSMGEVMQHSGTYSDDEIERILSSGTSMDRQMMARVLRKIISNLGEHTSKGYAHLETHSGWFWRLRNFDESTFDAVVQEWLDSSLMACQMHTLRIAVPHLVAASCLALPDFMESLRSCISAEKCSQLVEPCTVALDGLSMLLPSSALDEHCSPQDAYRYRTAQSMLCFDTDTRIVCCIGEVAELVTSMPTLAIRQQNSKVLYSDVVTSIMKRHIVSQPDILSRLKAGKSSSAAQGCFKSILDTLLDPTGQLHMSGATPEEQVVAVFKVASELSLPICQAMIESLFSGHGAFEPDAADALSAALLSAVRTAVEEDQSQGLELLTTLDAALTDKIRAHAEREILDASSFLISASNTTAGYNSTTALSMVQKYLTVIDLTSSEDVTNTTDQPPILTALVDRLKGISHAFNSCAALNTTADTKQKPSVLELYTWLDALLHLAVAHGAVMLRTATYLQQTALVAALDALLAHTTLELYPSITEHVFDVAVFLSDHLSNDARSNTSRLDAPRSAESTRSHFILGAAAPVDGWLVLTRPLHVPVNPQTASQPSTPGTIQNQSSPYQSPQMMASTPATPQQRYFNQQQQQRQQMQQAQQQQQMRGYPQQPNRQLPAQLQRTPSYQSSASPLQQMQHMQQMQGLAQQRSSQASPVHSQRMAPAAVQGVAGASGGNAPGNKSQIANQQREMRQYPFTQPRWEILAESSGNPSLNETAINLSLFGARKV